MMDQLVNIGEPNENKGFNTLCSKNAEHGPASMYILASDLLFQTALLKYNFAFFSGNVPVCSPN